MWVAFANAKAVHIFSEKNSSVYAIFNDQSFNDTLTNDIVSFEQLGPVCNRHSRQYVLFHRGKTYCTSFCCSGQYKFFFYVKKGYSYIMVKFMTNKN